MLDDKDRLILTELRRNSKATTKEIAERTGIPRTTVHDRICKMEAAAVIQKYTVIPNYEAVGEPTCAFILVSHDPAKGVGQKELAGEIAKIQGVYEVHVISGDWDIIAKVRAGSVQEIGDLVMERFRNVNGVDKTVTCTVFKTMREDV
ncbi:MAG: Lrp/AsnC family transcriptional regulator [Methanobacteriota archaeon]